MLRVFGVRDEILMKGIVGWKTLHTNHRPKGIETGNGFIHYPSGIREEAIYSNLPDESTVQPNSNSSVWDGVANSSPEGLPNIHFQIQNDSVLNPDEKIIARNIIQAYPEYQNDFSSIRELLLKKRPNTVVGEELGVGP